MTEGLGATVLAKLEYYNPASSVKDRIGIAMVNAAEASGELTPGGTIVESTSGNTGIALAMVGAARGYRVILTMPASMSKERRVLLKAFGAQIVLTDPTKGMSGAIEETKRIVAETPGAIWIRQFENAANPQIHRETTAQENPPRHRRRGRHPRRRASAPAEPSPGPGRRSRRRSPASR